MKSNIRAWTFLLLMAALGIFSTRAVSQTDTAMVWDRYQGNPVLPVTIYDGNNPIQLAFAYDLCVLFDSAHGRYNLWFQSITGKGGSQHCISYAWSLNGFDWFIWVNGPVLTPGPAGSFDQDGVLAPKVIWDGSQYRMYYMGLKDGRYQTGVATSSEGEHWTKYSGNPVIANGPPGSLDAVIAGAPCVLKEDGVYKMWYDAYDGPGATNHSRTSYATSPDGFTWTKYSGNPVLDVGPPGRWDSTDAVITSIVGRDSTYYAFYIGIGDYSRMTADVGLALSTDGIHWTKDSLNPVFLRGASGWDDQYVGAGTVILSGDTLHMWYSGKSSGQIWQIGYAKSYFKPGAFRR